MELTGPPVRLVLRIEARLSARQRRLLAVTFFRQIRPWLEYFSSSSLHHLEDHWLTVQREKVRPVRDFGRAAIDEPGGVSGYRIRMRRLNLGWTLQDLAGRTGLSRDQLSRLERGRCYMRRGTRSRIERALGVTLDD